MASDMDRACDDDKLDELEEEAHRPRCDGCGGVLEPWDAEPPVIYYCFHALHAGCAHGHDACPRCHTPPWVHDGHDDDDQPEPVEDEAWAAVSPPANDPDEDSESASDGVGVGMGMGNDDDRPTFGDGDFIEHGSHLGCCGCCSGRVAELEVRLEETCAALTQATNALETELERAQSCLCVLEEMYGRLEVEFVRLRDGKRARDVEEDAEERKKPRDGGRGVSSFPKDQTD